MTEGWKVVFGRRPDAKMYRACSYYDSPVRYTAPWDALLSGMGDGYRVAYATIRTESLSDTDSAPDKDAHVIITDGITLKAMLEHTKYFTVFKSEAEVEEYIAKRDAEKDLAPSAASTISPTASTSATPTAFSVYADSASGADTGTAYTQGARHQNYASPGASSATQSIIPPNLVTELHGLAQQLGSITGTILGDARQHADTLRSMAGNVTSQVGDIGSQANDLRGQAARLASEFRANARNARENAPAASAGDGLAQLFDQAVRTLQEQQPLNEAIPSLVNTAASVLLNFLPAANATTGPAGAAPRPAAEDPSTRNFSGVPAAATSAPTSAPSTEEANAELGSAFERMMARSRRQGEALNYAMGQAVASRNGNVSAAPAPQPVSADAESNASSYDEIQPYDTAEAKGKGNDLADSWATKLAESRAAPSGSASLSPSISAETQATNNNLANAFADMLARSSGKPFEVKPYTPYVRASPSNAPSAPADEPAATAAAQSSPPNNPTPSVSDINAQLSNGFERMLQEMREARARSSNGSGF